jgi:hypothetical protein
MPSGPARRSQASLTTLRSFRGDNPKDAVATVLRKCWKCWKALHSTPKFVLDWIKNSLDIPLSHFPHSYLAPNYSLFPMKEEFVDSELQRLLQCGVIEERLHHPRVVFPIGVVSKKNEKMRMIIDQRWLNRHVVCPKFKYEDLENLATLIRPGDWIGTLDLKDSYWHVPIKKAQWELLKIEWKRKYFVFKTLLFGLSLAPYTFTKVMRCAVAELRQRGIRCQVYMNDLIIQASSESE